MTDPIERVARLLAAARRPVLFTGAGVSTESGIPDFRSPGGVWDRFDPREMTYQHFVGTEAGRRRYWEIGRQSYPLMRKAEPNAAHLAKVIELHGNATRARCLDCGQPYSRDEVQAWLDSGVDIPCCPGCGGVVKPHTILFGEPMPAAATQEAERRARTSDLFVVVGSSLVVYPAAYMPAHAKHAGAALVIVNLSPTPYDGQADVLIPARAGEVMDAIVRRLRSLV